MIVLDTNVVSEPLRPTPEHSVIDWLDNQDPDTLFLTTINVAELFAGLEILPKGRRRSSLDRALREQILSLFEGRILPFDNHAAEIFGHLHARTQAAGHTMSFADGAIAAIAATHGFTIATRNTRDFRETGVRVLNPWSTTGL